MKAIEIYKKIEELNDQKPEIPWEVSRMFKDGQFSFDFAYNQISFGEDYVDLDDARKAIGFIVEQLGGKVKWSK